MVRCAAERTSDQERAPDATCALLVQCYNGFVYTVVSSFHNRLKADNIVRDLQYRNQ
jgi:hypothetical protein